MAIQALADVKRIIAVHSAKGGVGKSTVSVNLAVGLAAHGARVGLLDADVHGPSAHIMLGAPGFPEPGPDERLMEPLTAHGVKFISMGNLTTDKTPLIWRGAMVHSALQQLFENVVWGELDYLLIDMPPGTGDAQISVAQTVPLAGVVTVSTPQELALADSLRGIRAFQQMRAPILGLVENMSCFVCDDCGDAAFIFGEAGVEMLAQELGAPFLGKLPIEPCVSASGDEGRPFIVSHPDSASARAMQAVIDRFLVEVERHAPARAFSFAWRKMDWNERFPDPPEPDMAGDGPVKAIWQVSSDELGLVWRDGRKTMFSARELRQACPCASCVDEWSGKPLLDPDSVAGDVSLEEVSSVGRYAIAPVFSDGHRTGIYHFNRLRKLADAKKAETTSKPTQE